jgi:hypothetical protein
MEFNGSRFKLKIFYSAKNDIGDCGAIQFPMIFFLITPNDKNYILSLPI